MGMNNTNTVAALPIVGGGANVSGHSDVYAYTVVSVAANGRSAVIQEDTATLLNGFNSGEPDALTFTPGGFCGHTSGNQRYNYQPNPEAPLVTIRLRKDGVWRTPGAHGQRVRFGERRKHHDYNF